MASARSKSKEQILSARSLLFEQVAQAPYQFDFYHLLRRLEGLQPDKPRFGHAQRPNEETVRLAQEPALTFAPSNISAIDYNGDGVALGELYRSDATPLDPDGTRLVGQTAIRDYFVAGLGGPIKGAKTTLTVLSVRSPTPDVAVGEGTYVFEMAGQPPVRGVWMNVAVRTNGRWRIHSDIGAPAAK